MPAPEPVEPAPAAAAPAASRGFLSSQFRTLLATGVVVAALGTASAPWLLSSPARISALVARAVPELQADVRFGGVTLGWLGPLVFDDVRVVPRDGSRDPFTIRRIEVSHGLAGILLSLGDLGRLRIEGLEADLVFDADRDSNLKGLFLPAADAGAAGRGTGPKRSPVRLELDVVNAVVRIEGPWTTEPWVSDPINVRAALAPSSAGHSEWRIEPVQLLADARLEPGVAQGVLAYIAPIMADATRTSGRFSLRLDGATLPVGAPEEGELSGMLAMHAVDLGPGPLVSRTIQSLPIQLPGPPTVRIADESRVEFRLADRKIWHKGLKFGVPLAKPGQRLDIQSSGSVALDDKSLDLKLELPIPGDLPQERPLLASLAGRAVSIRIGGALGEPRVNFDGSLRSTAGQVVAEFVDRLRSGGAAPRLPQGATPLPPPPPAPKWRGGDDAAAADAAVAGGAVAGGAVAGGAAANGNAVPADAAKPPVGAPAQAAGNAAPQPVSPAGAAARPDPAANAAGAKPAAGDAAQTVPNKLDAEGLKAKLPPGMAADPATDAVIDLVGGVLGEVAKRRAERQAAEADNPQQPAPPRRGRLLRRLLQPQGPGTAPAEPAPAP